jgi:hypothetical protein
MANRDINILKTEKEQNADSKNLDLGVGDFMIPNSSKRQRIGFSKGITNFKQTKKNDAFSGKNRGKDFTFSL